MTTNPPMKPDLMLDIETLGTRPGCAILEIAASGFIPGRPDPVGPRFYAKIDLLDSLAHGLTACGETAAWHLSKRYLGSLRGESLSGALRRFSAFIARHYPGRPVWAWGMDFERKILEPAVAAVSLPMPWEYRLSCDARSFFTLAFGPHAKRPPRFHRASADVDSAIRDLAAALAALSSVPSSPSVP